MENNNYLCQDYNMENHNVNSIGAEHCSQKVFVGNELAQILVQRAYNFFVKEFPQYNALQVTSKCLQICDKTVDKYKGGSTNISLLKVRRKRKHPSTDVRDGIVSSIREEIYNIYREKKHLTVATLLLHLKEKNIYSGGEWSLRKILKNIGFRYKKDDPRRGLIEQPHIVHMHAEFLKKYMANEFLSTNKNPYIFLDETWIFKNGNLRRSWQDDSIRSVKKITGEGKRYIILHAGSEKGFITGASLIFQSSNKSCDYHDNMNSTNFEKWLKEQLLPKLEEPSIIILDNARYHSRQNEKWPTKNSTNKDMQLFLKNRSIEYSAADTKALLWAKIKEIPKPDKSFIVDLLIQEAGHEVLRLPPYHCHFNAIELVWSQTKRFYDQQILTMKDPIKTWQAAIESVTPEQWNNYVMHTDKIIKKAYEKEKVLTEDINPIIIHLGTSDDTDFS